jgi:hypothetical protein
LAFPKVKLDQTGEPVPVIEEVIDGYDYTPPEFSSKPVGVGSPKGTVTTRDLSSIVDLEPSDKEDYVSAYKWYLEHP